MKKLNHLILLTALLVIQLPLWATHVINGSTRFITANDIADKNGTVAPQTSSSDTKNPDLTQYLGNVTTPGSEWVEYDIDVQTAGNYKIFPRVATTATWAFDVKIDGTLAATLGDAQTGGWGIWSTVRYKRQTVALTQGTHKLRLEFKTGKVNLNILYFELDDNLLMDTHVIQGTGTSRVIAARDIFDREANITTANCTDEVETDVTRAINQYASGRWIEYRIHVKTGGNYKIYPRIATTNSSWTSNVIINSVNVASFTGGTTGGWGTWTTKNDLAQTVTLTAGTHTLRLESTAGTVNVNVLYFECVDITVNNDMEINTNAVYRNIVVNAGKKLTVAAGITLTADEITLESDVTNGTATFVNNGTANITIANVEQYLSTANGRQWYYLASPVTGVNSSLFGDSKVGHYNESQSPAPGWSAPYTEATELSAGKGYVVKLAGENPTVTFSGSLNNGNKSITVTRTGTTAAKRGFNLVGNPYPSYLDWTAATKTNVRNTIWYRTVNSSGEMVFATVDGEDVVAPGVITTVNKYVPPMQAFWIRVDEDGNNGSVTFNNSMRSHRTGNLLKVVRQINNRRVLHLKVSNEVNSDETLLVGDEDASNGFDRFDAHKMSNSNAAIPEIYTLAGTEELVINHRNTIAHDDEIALGFRTSEAGSFSINAITLANLETVTLIDKLTGTEFDLTSASAYTFTSDVTDSSDRFVIAFRAPQLSTGIENSTVQQFKAWSVNGNIAVSLTGLQNQSVLKAEIFNTVGQKLYEQVLNEGQTTLDRIILLRGIYMVKVGNETSKVVVR